MQYQSLLYEEANLRKEVSVCRDFQYENPEPELISELDFLNSKDGKEHTKKQKGLGASDNDKAALHALQLSRLSAELDSRKTLVQVADSLDEEKRRLQLANKKQLEFLNSLQSKVANVYKTALPIRQELGSGDDVPTPDPNVRFLPRPLYTLFYLTHALMTTSQSSVRVRIDGDIEAAERLYNENLAADGLIATEREAHTSRDDTGSRGAEDVEEKKVEDSSDAACHPLSLILEVPLDPNDASEAVQLCFSYSSSMKRVYVVLFTSGSSSMKENGPSELHQYLLLHLYKDDSGEDLLDIDQKGNIKYKSHGVPYWWVQQLCGLYYPHPREPFTDKPSVADVIVRIQRRYATKIHLASQLSCLSKLFFSIFFLFLSLAPVMFFILSLLDSLSLSLLVSFLSLPLSLSLSLYISPFLCHPSSIHSH